MSCGTLEVAVGLVDHDKICELHHTFLDSLQVVSTSWRQHCGVDGMSSNRLLNVTVFIYLYS